MTRSKVDPTLMTAADKAFWKQVEDLDRPEERYFVIDTATGDVLVQNARLKREKRVVEV